MPSRKYNEGDLIGPNNILLLKRLPNEGHNTYALFKCPSCGKEFKSQISPVVKGIVKSCGCQRHNKENFQKYKAGDLVGPYNILMVERTKIIQNHSYGKFICPYHDDSNHIFETRIESVVSGHTRSCGCQTSMIDYTGTRFGKLVAIEPTSYKNGTNVYWKMRCDCGNICYVSSDHIKNTKSCGCISSKGNLAIREILNDLNIFFIAEYRFKDCKNINTLPFDFFLPELNTCIEYDGEQHFNAIDAWGGIEKLQKQQNNDTIKNKYCEKNNIKLIRIPYYDFEQLDNNYILRRL
jgi:very-short-patch-repair endonuclease